MISDIQKTAESKMLRSLEVLKENLAKVRTGRAHTGLLDQVEVRANAGSPGAHSDMDHGHDHGGHGH